MFFRNLQGEKQFYVRVGDVKISDTILHIIESYTIMGSYIEYNTTGDIPTINPDEFGTFCHIDTEENIYKIISSIKGLRYIGYVNGNESIVSLNCNGYVGIPIKAQFVPIQPGMWKVSYPHITLASPMGSNKFNEFKGLIGVSIEYEMSEIIKTKSTYSHSVLINKEEMHVTRLVLDGQKPFIAKREMEGIRGNTYTINIGYPVIM